MKHEARAVPHAPAYLSCVAGLVGWPGHLRTLARVMFPRMFPTLLTRSRKSLSYREAPVGIEPTNRGFADLCLTTWLRRRGRQKSPKHLGFSTPQSFHQLCGPRQHLLILHRKMGDVLHQSLNTPRTSLLEKALARRRRLDQLHPTIFGVTNPAHQPAPL